MKLTVIFEPNRSILPSEIHKTQELICEKEISDDTLYDEFDVINDFIKKHENVLKELACAA